MKQFKFLAFTLAATAAFSCSSDDDDAKTPVNEEEVITTVTAVFTPQAGGTPITLTSRDLDGDGPNPPAVTVSGDFMAGTVYHSTVSFLNELATPAEDITAEVEEEGAEHQIFFVTAGGDLGTFTYADEDSEGNPVGLHFTYNAPLESATGTLTILLVHEPDKSAPGVAEGSMTNAGGNTDASVQFTVAVVQP